MRGPIPTSKGRSLNSSVSRAEYLRESRERVGGVSRPQEVKTM